MNLCFVGGGNMATALLGGLLKGDSAITQVHVIEPHAQARDTLVQRFAAQMQTKGVGFSVDGQDCPQALITEAESTWIMLAVKPQQMKQACSEASPSLKTLLTRGQLLSIAAGISIDALSNWCGNRRIVRAMPNTPALVTQGVTGMFAHPSVNATARKQAEQLMCAVGQTVWIDNEALMDAVTALSGSGPAYVFRFVEALSHAGEQLGLSRQQSFTLTIETIKGAIALLESSGEDPATLRDKVTSKGGTTAAALASLDQARFMQIIEQALTAARDRGAEMSKEFR